MMITLNLLPENEKKEVQLLHLYLAIKNFMFILLIGVLFSGILLLMGKIILLDYFTETVTRTLAVSNPLKVTSAEIRAFKQEISEIKTFQSQYIEWSKFFEQFGKLVNEGVTVSSLKVNETGELEILAVADQRSALLRFEENLKNSGYFKDFKIPYEVLFAKNDITFSLKLVADIKKMTQ